MIYTTEMSTGHIISLMNLANAGIAVIVDINNFLNIGAAKKSKCKWNLHQMKCCTIFGLFVMSQKLTEMWAFFD